MATPHSSGCWVLKTKSNKKAEGGVVANSPACKARPNREVTLPCIKKKNKLRLALHLY